MKKDVLFGLLAIMSIFIFSAYFIACGDDDDTSGDDDDNNDTGDDDDDTSGTLPEGLCNANTPCPSGQFCWNGLCAIGCTSNENCASDQYCNTDMMYCINKVTPGCSSDSDCELSQECRNGLCSEKPVETPPACEWTSEGKDGCESDEVCIGEEEDSSTNACYKFPPCGEGNECPVGTTGSVCNTDSAGDKLLPSKDAICLTGLCRAASDCPNNYKCDTSMGPIGFCIIGGATGSCETDADCSDPTPKCCDMGMGMKTCQVECF